jgi:hypothetical protein
VINCTFSGNSAHSDMEDTGGAIYNGDGGAVTITNTIVAKTTNGGDCLNDGTVTDGGHNLIEDTGSSCGLTNGENGNIVGVDPLLCPDGLQDNGGPTQTSRFEANGSASSSSGVGRLQFDFSTGCTFTDCEIVVESRFNSL